MNKLLRIWIIWSNTAFVAPLLIGLAHGLWIHAFFIALTMIFSFAYHIANERSFAIEDRISAITLISINLILLIERVSLRHDLFLFWISIALGAFALSLLKASKKLPVIHGFWHIMCAAITACCQLFLLGY